MTGAVKLLPDMVLILFIICFVTLFYLSVRKCFWRKDKGRGKLFFMTLAANPILLWFVTTFAAAMALGLFQEKVDILLSMTVSTILYLLLVFLCSRAMAKKLAVFNRSFVTFVCLMFSVIWSLAMRSDISAAENAPAYGWAFDAVTNLVLLAACVLLYRFVISALSC